MERNLDVSGCPRNQNKARQSCGQGVTNEVLEKLKDDYTQNVLAKSAALVYKYYAFGKNVS